MSIISISAVLAGHTDIEAIPLATATDALVLLRLSRYPQHAICVWDALVRTTRTRIRLPLIKPNHSWYVMCACCPSETYGAENVADEPLVTDDYENKYQAWRAPYAEPFAETLIQTCREHGISELFLRNASSWSRTYGSVRQGGVRTAEAEGFASSLISDYGEETRDALAHMTCT